MSEHTTLDAWVVLGTIYGQLVAIHGLEEAERRVRHFNDLFWQAAQRMATDTRVQFVGKAIDDIAHDIAHSAVHPPEEETKP